MTTSGTIESIVSLDDGQDVRLEGLVLLGLLGLDGLGLGLGGRVLQLVFQVLAGDVVLGVGALDLVLHGLLGALLVALDLLGGEPVGLLELLALLAALLGHGLRDLRRRRVRRGIRLGRRDVLDAVDRLAELGDLGVDDGLHVDLDVPVGVGDGRRLRDLDRLPLGDLALLRGGQLVEDLLDVLGVPEDAGDVREQQVRQEPAAHDLAGLEHLRERQDLGGVELDHPTLGVLAQDREEVQQRADVVLPHSLVAGGVREQVVGECVEDRQRALGREVEDVRVLLLEHVPGTLEGARVLRPERRLHVLGRGGQVGQHDDRGPLGHRDARG